MPLVAAIIMALGLVLVPFSPASAAVTQGISGTVTAQGGAPLENIGVIFLEDMGADGWGFYDYATTDASGHYAADLPVDDWRLIFVDGSGAYVSEIWDDTQTFDAATNVSVTASHVTSGISPDLAPAGHITGHIAGTSGGWVGAWTESTPGAGDWQPWSDGPVDPSGNYDVGGLSTGKYRIEFHADGFEPEFWKDKTDVATATSIDVTAPNTVSGIDPTLTPNGHITGHVEDKAGAPLRHVNVTGFVFDGTDWIPADVPDALTDASGDYDLSVPHGTYKLEFSAFDGDVTEYYDNVNTLDSATQIPVATSATVTGKDAVLDTGATISGSVTLPDGVYPDEVDGAVTVVDTDSGNVVRRTWLSDETAPGSGTYWWGVGDLPAGNYRVEFAREDGAAVSEAQFFDNHPESAGPGSATTVNLATGGHREVDATLRAGGTISGTLVDGDGVPLEGCDVVAFNNVTHLSKRVATTDADGTFVVTGLTTAKYAVAVGDFYQFGTTACPTTEYYTNANGDLSPSSTGLLTLDAAPGSDQPITADLVYGGTVATPDMTNTAPPTVPAGAPVVGVAVTADPGTWNPTGATFGYQWKANGADISGATSQSYTPVGADVGKTLSVAVTAHKSGYNDATVTSNATAAVTAPSQAPAIANTSQPAVVGLPRVGQELTAYAGTWYTQTGAPTTAVQWLRNGVPVPGATGATYTLGADDLGARVSLRVIASRDGYAPAMLVSAPTQPILAGILTLTDVPRMLGRLKVGKVLTAVPPLSSPTATGVRYQWLRNGVAIKGLRAKQARYSLVRADRGKHISVRVTVLRPGYAPTDAVARKAGKVK